MLISLVKPDVCVTLGAILFWAYITCIFAAISERINKIW